MVYDMAGNFIRHLAYDGDAYYSKINNFDREHLICSNNRLSADGTPGRYPLMIISKQDGRIVWTIDIPFEEKKTLMTLSREESTGAVRMATAAANYPVVPYFGGWILAEPSADTLYSYSADHTMTPFIVRTPSIQSMDPEVFLFPGILTGRYYFLQVTKKEFDFATGKGYPNTYLMYDRQEKALYENTVYNGDFSSPKEVYMTYDVSINAEITCWQKLEAPDLVEAYKDGKLTGRLAEIAATLDEEDTPVIMLLKHKK
jgi:hypothetical protein